MPSTSYRSLTAGSRSIAAARHLDPSLTPDAAVKELKNRPAARAAVRDAIVSRAPPEPLAAEIPFQRKG
jgi:hypothetical protein